MNKIHTKIAFCIGIVLLALLGIYVYLFYPQQQMPVGKPVVVTTPDTSIYHNDCLHPCIRYSAGFYYMAQSPYYAWNNKIENPLFYQSNDYHRWNNGVVLANTPLTGYNSDPCIMLEGDKTFYLWRECFTPLCDSLHCCNAIVGGYIKDSILLSKQVLAINEPSSSDLVQCPILMKRIGGGQYADSQYVRSDTLNFLYAVWYQYEPTRIGKGISIWQSKSLSKPDFELMDTIQVPTVYTVDRCKQLKIFGHIFYIPKPLKHDIWHFDLFEYEHKLYMVSVAEKGDNIMLSVSEDYTHFTTYRRPLVNNHYSENYTGYRQYFYKPTAFIQNDSLYVFYTANAKDDPSRNQLFVTSESVDKILH